MADIFDLYTSPGSKPTPVFKQLNAKGPNKELLRLIIQTTPEFSDHPTNFQPMRREIWFVTQDWLTALGYKRPGQKVAKVHHADKIILPIIGEKQSRDMSLISLAALQDILATTKSIKRQYFIPWFDDVILPRVLELTSDMAIDLDA